MVDYDEIKRTNGLPLTCFRCYQLLVRAVICDVNWLCRDTFPIYNVMLVDVADYQSSTCRQRWLLSYVCKKI